MHAPPTPRTEYVALVGSFVFVSLEAIIRILTLALREFYMAELAAATDVRDWD